LKFIFVKIALIAALIAGFSTSGNAQFYYGLEQEFGKNRVQYNDFFWSYYRFERFDTYFYTGGKELAEFTSRKAELHLRQIERFLDYPLDSRVEIILFNNLSDLKQSNIGLEEPDDQNIGGVTRLAGNKIFIYFDGNHNHLVSQIRAGVAEIVLNSLLYGGNIQDAVRNSALVNLPDWYTEGLISFLSNPWDTDIDQRVRDGVLSGKYDKFNNLYGIESRYVGHSIWNYIVNAYGARVVPHTVYMTVLNRNVDNGFLFVLGNSLDRIIADWQAYYRSKYAGLKELDADPDVLLRAKKEHVLHSFSHSPNGNYYAYVVNDLGYYRVFLVDKPKNKKNKIIAEGHRTMINMDLSFPLLTWHPNGKILALIYEDEGYTQIGFYNIDKKELQTKPLYPFNKITSIEYSPDGKYFLMSAVRNGHTDIYEYDILSNTFEQLTDDIYDDLHPTYLGSRNSIAFTSNRINDSISVPDSLFDISRTYDVFWFRPNTDKVVFNRMTNTPDFNEYEINFYDNGKLTFLSNQNGTTNRFLLTIDSAVAYVDTITHYRYIFDSKQVSDKKYNITEESISPEGDVVSFIHYRDGRYWMLTDTWSEITGNRVIQDESVISDNRSEVEKSVKFEFRTIEHDEENLPREIDIRDYTFDPEFYEKFNQDPNKTKDKDPDPSTDPKKEKVEIEQQAVADGAELKEKFELPKQRNFVTAFFPESFTTQVDNSFINETYQTFSGGGPLFLNPSFNGLFKINLKDIMEDYELVGAFRLSANLNNNEFFIGLRDRSKRLDKELILHRRGQRANLDNFTVVKINTHQITYTLSWPFSEVLALKGSATYRNDQNILLATDAITLNEPDFFRNWGSFRTQLVFDNTIPMGLNLRRGARWKVFGEFYQDITNPDLYMGTAGVDFRKYMRLHRTVIWANRFAAGTSFGTQKLAYFMGGVDNWFAPRYDNTTPIDFSQNYAFQTLATNMRGHDQNIRNGNSFFVVNSELRVPLFRYLFNRPLKSDFFNNFMVVGFGDLGTAWTGLTPYSEENFLNEETVSQGNITVNINTQVEPIVGGYGIGLRSRLFGYYVRADWAWGWEDGIVYDAKFFISLGTDF
jgi:Tol biopolymer transport system component